MSKSAETTYKALTDALAEVGVAEGPAAQIAETVVAVRAETAKRGTTNIDEKFANIDEKFAKVHEAIANARLEAKGDIAKVMEVISKLQVKMTEDIAKARLETKDDITKSTNQTRNWNLGLTTAIIAAMGVTVAALKYL